jgi:hypothetical protein
MKIAAISDIHGNVAALDAVLGDIATRHGAYSRGKQPID